MQLQRDTAIFERSQIANTTVFRNYYLLETFIDSFRAAAVMQSGATTVDTYAPGFSVFLGIFTVPKSYYSKAGID